MRNKLSIVTDEESQFIETDEPYIPVAGPSGDQGPAGSAGKDGETVTGPIGPSGRDGRDGKDGAQGPAGKDGRNGLNGKDGADGAAGEAGIGAEIILYAGKPNEKQGKIGDVCLNTQTGELFERAPFADNKLIWKYKGNLKGLKGDQGERGFTGNVGPAGANGSGGGASSNPQAYNSNKTLTTETFARAYGAAALAWVLPDATLTASPNEIVIKQTATGILTIAPNAANVTVNGVASIELPALDVSGFGEGNLGSSVRFIKQGGTYWVN